MALVDVHTAVFAGESGPACAPIVVVQIGARAAVRTRQRPTQVNFGLAQLVYVAGNALATKATHEVDASAAVEARIAATVVLVRLTIVPDVSRGAGALVSTSGRLRTNTSV